MFESKLKKNNESLNLKRIENIINGIIFQNLIKQSNNFENIPEFIYSEINSSDIIVSLPNIDYRISLFPTNRTSEIEWFTNQFSKVDIYEKNNPKIILLLCFICYRLRNNLFHGNKKFEELHNQKELFEITNRFLSELLIKIKDIDFQ
jgi:hypothetical protein